MKPMFKGGDRHDPVNCRPISLTSVAGKVVKMLFKNDIENHFENETLWAFRAAWFLKEEILRDESSCSEVEQGVDYGQ